ncbi:hypothetical protein NA57DRAFT_33034 [Rhizodiscina lignyota]|uniref:Uncharacterized protein n=1 Tax=Rhizodiscina lignyota TaxID=1504668 RepID=A0A9P4INA6_9PEZI|nr:hypothetical protein NA57DRAFT_33034 [Rhizodiscina lignyota]
MGGGPSPVDLLILGAGWTSTFLIPLLDDSDSTSQKISYAATTRDGRNGTIPFTFDPDSDDTEPYKRLPSAKIILITFPVTGSTQPKTLVERYECTHPESKGGKGAKYILLGATSIWKEQTLVTEASPYDHSNERAQGEDALMQLCGERSLVLSLAGLYGGERDPRTWGVRVVKSKSDVKKKGAVHLVNGRDVARGVLGCGWSGLAGKRWIVTDLRCYDWWDLLMSFDDGAAQGMEFARWVGELMVEEGVSLLPREPGKLGRVLDGRAFWNRLGIWPSVRRVC